MAHRYWKACWSMGYAGTDAEEEIDLVDYFNLTVEEVEKMSDSEAEEMVANVAWDYAKEMIDSWAEKIDG